MERRRSSSRLHGLFSRLSTQDQAKKLNQERPKKGDKFLAPPSKLDIPITAPVPKSVPPQNRPRGLWDDAFDAVSSSSSDRDLKGFASIVRESVEQHSTIIVGIQDPNLEVSPELQICRDVLQVAKAQQTKHKEKQWSLSQTRKVNIGQVYGQVATCVQKFVGVGDNLAQLDPVHFALPWAAVRLILTVSIANYESDVAVLEGLGVISQLIYRCSIFEDYYLNVQPPLADELQKGLKGPLVTLYGSIALFLLEAQKYFRADVATRALKAVTTSDRFQKLCGDIKKHEEEVHNYERLALQKSANDQYLALRTFVGAYDDHLRQQERKAVLDWMSDIDYRGHHNGVLARLMVGTGNWLFKKEQYVQWDTSPRSALLWLRGDAGTGKSTIMASLIDHFESQPRLESSEALAYFYCSRTSGDNRRQDPTAILRSICQQLSCPMRGLPLKPAAVRIHLRETSLGSKCASFGLKECQQLFTELVNDYTNVTVLVDALDEIDSNSRFELFSFLVRVGRSTKTTLKIIVSSRNESDIYDYFGGGKNYYIESSDNAKDIEQYVKHELSRRLLFGKASKALIMKVENLLNSKAEGIFRWVELQVNSLCDPEYVHCAEDVEETLYRLPETLELTYQDSLHKISRYRATSSGSMKDVLRLLLCAEETLSSDEVLAAVAPNQQGHKIFSNPMDVVRMSRSLVVLDQSSEEFRFAHLSVREFLEQHPDFSIEKSHYGAAQMCLGYVMRASKWQKRSGNDKNGESQILSPFATTDSFLCYATYYWPRHCKKAGSLRLSGRLKALMTAFLLETDDDKVVFGQWNHDIRSFLERFYYESRELFKEHRQSASYPACPLFLVCTYGFPEFTEPMMTSMDLNTFLNRKNVDGLTILETCAYNGHLELTKQLLTWATTNCEMDGKWATSLLARAARGCPDAGVIKFLLSELQDYKINSTTLIAAANNCKCGADVLGLLLDQRTVLTQGFTGAVVEVILANCRTADAIHFLHSRFKSAIPPKAMLMGILTNPNADYKLVDLAVAEFDPTDITEDLVVALLHADSNSKEKFDVLFSRNPECPTTSRTLRAATSSCDTEVFQYLCSRCCGPGPDEQVLVEAMRNEQSEEGIALMLIQNDVDFSDWSLEKACICHFSDLDCLKLLLQKPESLAFGPELLETVSYGCRPGVVALLLHEFTEFEITKSLLKVAFRSSISEEIEIILAQPRAFSIDETVLCTGVRHESDSAKLASTFMQGFEQFEPSEELMISIAQNRRCGSKYLKLLSSKFETLPVTHEVLKIALGQRNVAVPLIDQLFEHYPQKEVTEEHLCAAATREVELMDSLLHRKGYLNNHAISEAIIRAAIPNARKGRSSAEVLRMVLSLRPSEDKGFSAVGITKSLLTYAVSVSSEEAVKLLWDTFDGILPIPTIDEMVTAAASHPSFPEALAILRSTIGEVDDVTLPELPNEAYLAAANNEAYEKEGYFFLNMLFSLSRPKIIREDLVEAAACNNRCAPALMEFLITYELKLPITEKVLIAAARNNIQGESTLRLLIDHIGADVRITTPILIAAAENGRCGFNLLELLLPYAQGGTLPQEVANAAAGAEPTKDFFLPKYWWSGQPTLRFVLKQPSISITEEVLRIAAGNQYLGLQFVRLLIAHPKNKLPLRQTMIEAAVGNAVHGELIIKHLLKQRPGEIPLNEKIVSVAMDNKACGSLILQWLLGLATERNDHESTRMLVKAVAREENGLCTALFQAAYRDQAAAVHALIDGGADVKVAKYDIGTALHVAAFKGQLAATKALVEHGADVNAVGGPHRTALAAACEKSNVDVIQYLVDAGADIDALDVVGRTPLHRALGSSSTTVTDCLLSLGANILISDRLGCSAIHHAARTGFLHGLEMLVESKISVSATDRADWTPLHWSARNGNIEAVQLLIRAGADPKTTNAHGQTPLVVAMFFGNDHLYPLLSDSTEVPEYTKGVRNGVVSCDICRMDIYGDRFECVTCEGYDLCYRCITDKDEVHDSSHEFLTV